MINVKTALGLTSLRDEQVRVTWDWSRRNVVEVWIQAQGDTWFWNVSLEEKHSIFVYICYGWCPCQAVMSFFFL